MSHWIHFKYNKKKGRYVRSKPSPWRHLLMIVRHLLSGICIGGTFIYLFIYFVGSPGEWKLEKEHRLLLHQYMLLEARLNDALNVMSDIGQRDDNLYRMILQGEPIGENNRNAIIDNANRYDSLLSLTDAALVVSVSRKMDLLERQLYLQSRSFDEVVTLSRNQEERLRCIPAIQPVADKALRRMASGYGWRIDPIYNTRKFHSGMDFSAEQGTSVFVTGNGRVVSAGWQRGYGLCIEVEHGFGYKTRYGHLSKKNVIKGQIVKRGDKIGEVGNTGKSTASHLHYEVWLRGAAQNPINYYYLDLTPEAYDELVQRAANVGQILD